MPAIFHGGKLTNNMETDSSPIPIGILLIAAGILILLSLSFSAAESAFLSVNKLRLRSLKNQKNKRAIRVLKLLSDKERLINTLLIGNNIVNVALSSIITFIAIKLFGSAGVGIATFCATILLLVFGEISPKTIATHHPEAIAFFFCAFINFVQIILTPFVFLFTHISRFILKLMGIDTRKKNISFTEEEIKTFIDVSSEAGIIENNEKTMMRQVFKFSDLEAKDIMIPRKEIKALHESASYSEIIEFSQKHQLSRFPIYREDIDDIIGVLYLKDLLFISSQNNFSEEEFSVSKVMRPPLFILETKKMSSIQQMLRENRQSIAIVIDEYSGTDGVLTTDDITFEIFGPVENQNRNSQSDSLEPDSSFSGLTRLIDLNEKLNTKIESRNCETIGGYICEILGHIPQCGESISSEEFTFTVVKMEDKRVAQINACRRLSSENEEEEE